MNQLLFITFLLASFVARAETVVPIGIASNFSEMSSNSSNPYGGYFRDGVKLALKDSESKLKKKGITVELQEFDYGITDIKVLGAARKAAASNVLAVIGYNYSSHALLAAPIHQQAKLPMITPSATANRLDSMGAYIHEGCFSNAYMAEVLAKTAREKLHAQNVVLLPAANCAYCSDLSSSFDAAFKKLGGTTIATLPVLSDEKDFSSIAIKLKGLDFDAILVPNEELTSARIICTRRFPKGPFWSVSRSYGPVMKVGV